MDIWEMIFDQRRQLTSILETLDDAQWNASSLCTDWNVREVVGHLVSYHELGTSGAMLRWALNGFNFNKMNAKVAKTYGKRSSADLIGLMRKHTESRWIAPGLGPGAPLTDVVLHTEDICRPLGITQPKETAKVCAVLDFLVGPQGKVITQPAWLAGLRLAPHDADWSWGSGSEVNGTAFDMMVAISGRYVAIDSLTGDGVDQLRSRVPASI
ncbi:MAG: hypothetical protein ETSY1_30580 [Candidatus Entotheonella factor]|uniref:Mycothiol-dependent maleylpyruvate isomerase metal-binding domain-containing protein n=1 Tax=Entotheonella factor TaxID=1429438 RepID=W4LBZ5_ENTF1|nr:MAG: hypothetical protein ETSY1_30580 [Candidatus Entotheonella factor]